MAFPWADGGLTFIAVLDIGIHRRPDPDQQQQPDRKRKPGQERSILLSAHEILQQAHMPTFPALDVGSMFPAEFVDVGAALLLGVGTGGGTPEADGFCSRAELHCWEMTGDG